MSQLTTQLTNKSVSMDSKISHSVGLHREFNMETGTVKQQVEVNTRANVVPGVQGIYFGKC